MKNITKEILYTLAASALVVSCAKDAVVEDVAQSGDGVPAAVSFVDASSVRATDTAFEQYDLISVTAYDSTDAIYEANAEYEHDGNTSFTSDDPIMSKGEALSYLAVYPYVSVPTDKMLTFSVEEDQSLWADYTASDLMLSSVAATTDVAPTLQFSHLLSKVVLTVESDGVSLDGGVSVTLDDVATTVVYDLSSSEPSATSGLGDVSMFTNEDGTFQAVIVPQDLTIASTVGTVTVDGKEYEFSLLDGVSGSYVSFEAGKVYSITVNIEPNEVSASYEINPWNEGDWDGVVSVTDTIEINNNYEDDPFEVTVGGEGLTLSATTASTSTLIWSSSDESKATVANGVVTAVAGGVVTIKVEIEGDNAYDTCEVTVIEPVSAVTISSAIVELYPYSSTTLSYSYGDTVYPEPDAADFTWVSSDESVATVANGVVTAVAEGTANITVTYGEITSDVCVVTVSETAIGKGTYYISEGQFTNDPTVSGITGIVYAMRENSAMVVETFSTPVTSGMTYGADGVFYNVLDGEGDDAIPTRNGRKIMAAVQTATDVALSSHQALRTAAGYNADGVPTYAEDTMDAWYLGSCYEMCELYAAFSGLELVDGTAGAGQISYDEWSALFMAGTTIMPGATADDQIKARLIFNQKIVNAGGRYLFDTVAGYSESNGFRGYYTSTDTAAGTHAFIYHTHNNGYATGSESVTYECDGVEYTKTVYAKYLTDNSNGYLLYTSDKSSNHYYNRQVRGIMEAALPVSNVSTPDVLD